MKIAKTLFKKSDSYTVDSVKESLNTFKNMERYDIVEELKNQALIDSVIQTQKKFESKKHFVQVGIGGSSLGSEMLISALKASKTKFTFINNIDPDYLYEQLAEIDIKESLFYVVSKSGGTPETIATFAIVSNVLKENGISEDEFKNYFVFATDPVKSSLKDLGEELSIDLLSIPSNVGGRFSVLTPVGLLPAAFAGINIETLCSSAYDYAKELEESAEFYSICKDILDLEKDGITQTVLMPYSSKLRDLSFWFVQLWAESLGKEGIGLTPVPSYGPTDQHSQMQLFMEGPFDKLMFMLNIKNTKHDFTLKNNFKHPRLEILKEFSLKNLMDAEFFGTLKALSENKRSFIQLEIDEICEKEVGKLIIFFEYLTVVVGNSLKIDPFNQPGVEAGKIFAFEWLEKLK